MRGERGEKLVFPRIECRGDLAHLRLERLQRLADRFRQCAQQRADLLGAHSGHHPLQLSGGERARNGQRDVHGHAVLLVAGIVFVGERQDGVREAHLLGECIAVVVRTGIAEQILLGRAEEIRLRREARFHKPLEVVERRDSLDACGVEAVEHLVEHERAVVAHAGQRGFHLHAQALVFGEEAELDRRLRLDERAADENLRGLLWLDAPVVHKPARDFEAAEDRALRREHAPRLCIPIRIAVALRAEVRAEIRDPLGQDARGGARVERGGLDDFRSHDPLRLRGSLAFFLRHFLGSRCRLLPPRKESAAGEYRREPVAGGLVGVAFLAARDVAEQAREHRAVDALVVEVAVRE